MVRILIVKAVAEQYGPGEAGNVPFHRPLPCGGEAEVLAVVGQDAAAVVTPADDHHLSRLLAVHGAHRGHPGAVLGLDGVAVDIEHHLDAGVLG